MELLSAEGEESPRDRWLGGRLIPSEARRVEVLPPIPLP